jgi:Fe2+ transport system protein FeoA
MRFGRGFAFAGHLRRLSELRTGEQATIAFTRSRPTGRRMLVLGLIDGVRIQVETRDRNGDLIITAEGGRFHVRSSHAERIWVASA